MLKRANTTYAQYCKYFFKNTYEKKKRKKRGEEKR